MIFDTHAHYDDEQFNEDRVELLNSMEEQGVGTIVNVSAAYNPAGRLLHLQRNIHLYMRQSGFIRMSRLPE